MSGQGILSRYVLVLEAVAGAPRGLTLTQAVQATGLPRGTVHRLLNALLGIGYLALHERRKIYVLGPRLNRLAHLAAAPVALAPLVRPALERLVNLFGETAFVARLAGERVESLCTVTPSREGQSHVQPGRIMPIHAAASAKAIFAFQDEAVIARALSAPRERFTRNTRVEETQVREDLAEVRRSGHAACHNEMDPGVASYAVPVHLPAAGVIYSVGLVGLAERMDAHPAAALIGALRVAADDLCAVLAGVPPEAQPGATGIAAGGVS